MSKPRLQLPAQVLSYALGGTIHGPWTLHGLARHLYPQLREELQKQYYPESNQLPVFWWIGWLLAIALGPVVNDESHGFAAAVLYILCGWLQAACALFISALYPQGLPQVRPTFRHYLLNECLEVWLPLTIALPLWLLAAGFSVSTCLWAAVLVPVCAFLLHRLNLGGSRQN